MPGSQGPLFQGDTELQRGQLGLLEVTSAAATLAKLPGSWPGQASALSCRAEPETLKSTQPDFSIFQESKGQCDLGQLPTALRAQEHIAHLPVKSPWDPLTEARCTAAVNHRRVHNPSHCWCDTHKQLFSPQAFCSCLG